MTVVSNEAGRYMYRYCRNNAERGLDPLGLVPPTPEQFKDPRNWTNGLPMVPPEALEALRVNILLLQEKAYKEHLARGKNAQEITFELRRPITGPLALRKKFTPVWFEADQAIPADFTRLFGLNGAVALPPQGGTTVIRVHKHYENPDISDNPDKKKAAGIPQGILTPGDVFKVYDPKSKSITEMRIAFR